MCQFKGSSPETRPVACSLNHIKQENSSHFLIETEMCPACVIKADWRSDEKSTLPSEGAVILEMIQSHKQCMLM